ncbi:outer membrane protein assembly factor BamA [Xanthovirga aplysinae]|uniref:outer membrane protein assembly factor BamA n=1 Tax=Xanthovirga aplysinae TaxID=2529853 RepID=UPI0012BD1227|nr:outer membrane protein assembly factor BamA [Xanthovirga aplysinae]MTI31653.1 outer membrane protein assembly factor BamA [Xanthovirga aplysinae]
MKKILFILLFALSYNSSIFAQFVPGNYSNSRNNNSTDVNYQSPKEYEIGGISVVGVEYLDENALISLSGLKVGDRIKVPGEEISNAIKKLWQQGIIGDATIYISKVENGKAFLVIELKERPRLTRFSFEGLNKTQESDLRDKIDLIRGRVLTDALIKNTELTIKKHFIEKGFYNTSVKIIQQGDTLVSNGVRLKILVDKKKKVKVRNIYVEGNYAFTDAKIKNKMKSTNEKVRIKLGKVDEDPFVTEDTTKAEKEKKSGWFHDHIKLNFLKSSKFVAEKFEEDKKALVEFYNTEGYRDAKIDVDTVFVSGKNTVDIRIKVNEGQRYYFRNITWTGNYIHSDKQLAAILGVQKGDTYNMELINTRLNFNPTGPDVSSLYMDNGYLFFNVQPVEVNVDGDSIDIEMRVNEGPQATINKIIVKGNDRTNDRVILREIRTLPGMKFSRADLIRTQRELSQLGYFDPEQIGLNPIPNPADGTVDIEYSLVEKPSDQIELSGGWGGTFGFVGTLGVTFTNFSAKDLFKPKNWDPLPVGDGQQLSIRAQANGIQYQNYSLTFAEPWLGGKKRNNFSVSLSHAVQRSSSTGDFSGNNFDGSLRVSSATVGLGKAIKWPDDYFTWTNSLSYVLYDLNNFQGSSFGEDLGFTDGVANNFNFTTRIARNSVDQPMYPRRGSNISLSVSLTPPYSLFRGSDFDEGKSNEDLFRFVEYNKWMFDSEFYIPIVGDLVLQTRAHFGLVGKYSANTIIGPFGRFLMGGSGLSGQNFLLGTDVIGLRGYEDNSILAERDGNTVDQGGVVFNKFVAELRYPITTSPAATIYVLGFAEAGNNWSRFADFNPNSLFRSAGVGARIFMPAFGLIGIDWGYGFDPIPGAPGANGSQFTFTIGQPIR